MRATPRHLSARTPEFVPAEVHVEDPGETTGSEMRRSTGEPQLVEEFLSTGSFLKKLTKQVT